MTIYKCTDTQEVYNTLFKACLHCVTHVMWTCKGKPSITPTVV